MAKDQTVPVTADVLKTDADALAAIVKMTGYQPANAEFALAKLTTASGALKSAADTFAHRRRLTGRPRVMATSPRNGRSTTPSSARNSRSSRNSATTATRRRPSD